LTRFEVQVKNAIEFSGISYKQLGKESAVHPAMISKFMKGERGLTVESVGKILDALGCMLTPPSNRFAPKPTGRPKKVIYDRDQEKPKSLIAEEGGTPKE